MPSLRRKVSYGYYAVVALLLGLSVFVVVELRLLERRIVAGEALAEFFDATLEIRRFEKNYFLYAQWEDLNESMRYAGRARELLDRNGAAFGAFVPGAAAGHAARPAPPLRVADAAVRGGAAGGPRAQGPGAGGAPRRQGDRHARRGDLGERAAQPAGAARALPAAGWSARSSCSRRWRSRSARSWCARSSARCGSLEQALNSVAEGRYEPVAIGSRDREIVSLTNALNRMLRERELHERHLIQSEKLASLGTLLSGVAHELNNPLSNISTSAQILAEEMGPGNCELAGELVGQIGEQTDRARNIVRSLLEFSRDREFRKEPLPLRPLVEETVRFLKGQIPPGVSVEVAVPAEITLPGDRQRLQQVFLNLVKNAVEAVPPETGRVVVSARRVPAGSAPQTDAALVVHGAGLPGGDVIEIEVRDNGPGIPPEIRKKIFDPFFTTKDVGKGSGLGLFVVYEIIDEHDGGIAVAGGPGGGTLFTIRLPA